LIVAGLLTANPQTLNLNPGPNFVATLVSPPFAISLVYVMYAYWGGTLQRISQRKYGARPRTSPGSDRNHRGNGVVLVPELRFSSPHQNPC
jgi:hypothetical protein